MAGRRGSLDWRAWAAEAFGTALLVLAIVLSAALSLAAGSPLADGLPGPGARFLALGVLVAPFVAALAVSPIGRVSVREGPALLDFMAARIAEELAGPNAYHAERARQTDWLVKQLRFDG